MNNKMKEILKLKFQNHKNNFEKFKQIKDKEFLEQIKTIDSNINDLLKDLKSKDKEFDEKDIKTMNLLEQDVVKIKLLCEEYVKSIK